MHITILSNEYPPHVYGGAGVHVEYLTRELAALDDRQHLVDVVCFGDQRVDAGNLTVQGVEPGATVETHEARHRKFFDTMLRDLAMAGRPSATDVVHCHTWYSHFGGILAKLIYGIPMVLTVHSLEPLRPWKREQLGGGYEFSSWVEKTAMEMADAVIAVSEDTKRDVLRLFNVPEERVKVIHNGIDPHEYHRVDATDALVKFGIDPTVPYVLFVGRVTRQKGIVHLVRAIQHFDHGFQVVLVGGAPDTPEIEAEMKQALEQVRRHRDGVFWVDHVSRKDVLLQLYSHAAVFCCPSIYEPFGIINLEAMACETAVVASAVGGIKEVVVHGETGYLVPVKLQTEAPFEPVDAPRYSADLAARVNQLMADPALRRRFAAAGRQRVVDHFSWRAIAEETKALYQTIIDRTASTRQATDRPLAAVSRS